MSKRKAESQLNPDDEGSTEESCLAPLEGWKPASAEEMATRKVFKIKGAVNVDDKEPGIYAAPDKSAVAFSFAAAFAKAKPAAPPTPSNGGTASSATNAEAAADDKPKPPTPSLFGGAGKGFLNFATATSSSTPAPSGFKPFFNFSAPASTSASTASSAAPSTSSPASSLFSTAFSTNKPVFSWASSATSSSPTASSPTETKRSSLFPTDSPSNSPAPFGALPSPTTTKKVEKPPTGEEDEERIHTVRPAKVFELDKNLVGKPDVASPFRECGKGTLRLNILKGDETQSRLILREDMHNTYRLILNLKLFKTMGVQKAGDSTIRIIGVKDGAPATYLIQVKASELQPLLDAIIKYRDLSAPLAVKQTTDASSQSETPATSTQNEKAPEAAQPSTSESSQSSSSSSEEKDKSASSAAAETNGASAEKNELPKEETA